jgi:hypothetical protein
MTDLLPFAATDRQVTLSLEQIIKHRLGYSVEQLQLKVENDGIVLKGFAPSWYIKQLVQEIVMEHSTMPIVLNDIHVNFSCRI